MSISGDRRCARTTTAVSDVGRLLLHSPGRDGLISQSTALIGFAALRPRYFNSPELKAAPSDRVNKVKWLMSSEQLKRVLAAGRLYVLIFSPGGFGLSKKAASASVTIYQAIRFRN
jgi:hypothetical protein